MTNTAEWQGDVGRVWAETWRLTDKAFSGLTQQLLDRISAQPGTRVLDIGCGAGELALAIARQRPEAQVMGLDVSDALVAAARERGGQHGNAEFSLGDAGAWRKEGFAPDLLVSRHGVMFFDDPPAAFGHLRSIATPGARMVFSCFRSLRENHWIPNMGELLPEAGPQPRGDPHAPGPFAFADPQRIEAILGAAGWTGIDIAPADFAFVTGSGDDSVAEAESFFARIGPAAAAMRELGEDDRVLARERLRGWIASHQTGSLVAFPAAAWIVTAAN